MKIWRLISGILSMVSFLIITFQSCATGVVNVLEDNNHDTSDVAGFFVALMLTVLLCAEFALEFDAQTALTL